MHINIKLYHSVQCPVLQYSAKCKKAEQLYNTVEVQLIGGDTYFSITQSFLLVHSSERL